MAEFSYDTYFNSLLTTGNYRFAPKDCNKDEYRKGLVDTSKGIISVFDVDGKKNGKLNKAEYLLKEKKDYELSGGNAEYDEQKALDIFETLDINNDGELDQEEVATALHSADVSDEKGEDGNIGMDGFAKLFSESKREENKENLKYNYDQLKKNGLGTDGYYDESKIRSDFAEQTNGVNRQNIRNEQTQNAQNDINNLILLILLSQIMGGYGGYNTGSAYSQPNIFSGVGSCSCQQNNMQNVATLMFLANWLGIR